MLSVAIDPELEKRLEALGAKTETSKADFVRQAMMDALDEWEDAAVAEERLRNPGREYSMEEAERILGVDG